MIDIREYGRKVWSQRGEDGMLEKIFSTLKIEKGHAVELGAWDGKHLSNVYNLITKGWAATLIECDEEKFLELSDNMRQFEEVTTIKQKVTLEKGETLDEILQAAKTPKNFDLLSLDLDGFDYWVWRSLTFEPKVVLVEYNSNWEGSVTCPYDTEHFWDGTQFYGASGKALNDLAEAKGYELIGHVPNINLFFIKKELNKGLFKTLDIKTNFHVSKNHHLPMTKENFEKLVYNPPV
jgi:hypothetical protein